MAETKEVPEILRPYAFHGVTLLGSGNGEMVADCPFCGSEGKFNVNVESSLFRCWAGSCGEKGNPITFLRKHLEHSLSLTREADYVEFAGDCKFSSTFGMKEYGVALSATTGKWIVPGYNGAGEVTGLYKWTKIQDKHGKWVTKLLPTPGLGHHMFNFNNFDKRINTVDISEGWRDGIAWLNTYHKFKDEEGLEERNIISVPGTNSFRLSWGDLFEDMTVNILFDNDWPGMNKNTKEIKESAGVVGVKYLTTILRNSKTPPAKINYIAWGGEDCGHTDTLPDGTDLRDYLSN